jgi:hypothetical protein
MGGGLMQLVAYGAQDIYLTGNPQITFFKVVYRRHTNFAMEAVEQTMSGSAAYGGKAVATVSRNGDLVGRMYVEHNVSLTNTETVDTVSNYGHALLREVTCEIGGQEIDKHTGRLMQIRSDLTEPNPTGASATCAVATKPFGESGTLFQRMTGTGKGEDNGAAVASTTRIFVPLQFWFNRNPGLALPLIALQYHEVKVTVQFEDELKLLALVATASAAAAPADLEFKLYADYIYLDTDERRRFAQVSHEYLIEQVQTQDYSMSSGTPAAHNLTFNHPVKELMWQVSNSAAEGNLAGNNTAGDESTLCCGMPMTDGTVSLKLNGHERFASRNALYFTRTQVWQHHTGNSGTFSADSIGVYSFALKPEEHQPSGTCNFSRIDNAQLVAKLTVANGTDGAVGHGSSDTADTLHVYAVNYNVLRVMSGMGGLAYSN